MFWLCLFLCVLQDMVVYDNNLTLPRECRNHGHYGADTHRQMQYKGSFLSPRLTLLLKMAGWSYEIHCGLWNGHLLVTVKLRHQIGLFQVTRQNLSVVLVKILA